MANEYRHGTNVVIILLHDLQSFLIDDKPKNQM